MLYCLLNFSVLLDLFHYIFVMHFLFILFFLLFLNSFLLLFVQTGFIWNPLFVFFGKLFLNILLNNSIILLLDPFEIINVKDVIHGFMIDFSVSLETLKLEIYCEPLLTTYITQFLFIFLNLSCLFSKLREFVDDCTGKYVKDNLLSKQYIKDLEDKFHIDATLAISIWNGIRNSS
jgi:hypothetical protein